MNNDVSKAKLLHVSDAIENAPYVVATGEGPKLRMVASCGDPNDPAIRLAASCGDDGSMINRVNRQPVNED